MSMWSCPCSSDRPSAGEGPRPLEGLLKKVIKKMTAMGRPTAEEIAAAWRTAAGKRAARHTRPVSLRKSVLTVNVDGSSWLYELTTRKRIILRKLASKTAGKKINDIRFRIGETR